MKANELRIGNWVKWNYEERSDGNAYPVEFGYELDDIKNNPNIVKPIPLTEEWLVKLKNDGSFKLRFIKLIAAFEVQRKYVGIESGEEWIFISNVRYVHEWQNLHYALTGQELQTDETKKKVK